VSSPNQAIVGLTRPSERCRRRRTRCKSTLRSTISPDGTGIGDPHLISVRLAWLTLHESEYELIEAAERLGDDAPIDLVGWIGRSADWNEGRQKLLGDAERRITCAIAARSMLDAGGQ
jgi:hypothetical protein